MINAACFSVKVFPSWKSRWGREVGMYLGDSQKSLPDVGWNMIVLYVPQPLERTSWVSSIRAVLTKIKKDSVTPQNAIHKNANNVYMFSANYFIFGAH